MNYDKIKKNPNKQKGKKQRLKKPKLKKIDKKKGNAYVDITIFNIFIKDQCKQSTVTIPQALNNQDRAQGLY